MNRQDAVNAKFILHSAFLAGEAFSGDAGLDEVGAVALGAEALAAGLDTEGMLDRPVAEAARDAVFENFEMRVLELDHFVAVRADQVVVVRVVDEIRVVVLHVAPEVDLAPDADDAAPSEE